MKDDHLLINPAEIDSSEQPIGTAMRVIHATLLDRFLARGTIDEHQLDACKRYYRLHQNAGFPQPSVVTNLTGVVRGGGEDSEHRAIFSLDARDALRRCLPVIGSRLEMWELVVLHDQVSSLHQDMLSRRKLDAATAIAGYVVATVSADLIDHWRLR